MLRKLAAEGRRPTRRGVLPGCRAVLRPLRTPSASRRRRPATPPRQAPVLPVPSRRESRLLLRRVGLAFARRPRDARGQKFTPRKKGRGRRGGDPYPALCLRGGEINDPRTGGQSRRAQGAGEAGCAPGTEGQLRGARRASAPLAAGQRDSEGWRPPVSGAHLETRGRGRSRRRGARTASARRGAGQHLPAERPSSSGRSAGDAASSACKAGGGLGGEPSLLLAAPVSSQAPPPPPAPPAPHHPPLSSPPHPQPAEPFCPALAALASRQELTPQGPGALGRGGGPGRSRVPLPRWEAMLKLGICWAVLAPGLPPPQPREADSLRSGAFLLTSLLPFT